MEEQSYHSSIAANITAQQAFEGINNVPGWWAKNFEGNSQRLDDIFTVRFGETFGTFKITSSIPGKRIEWLNIDCYLDLLKNKTEWKGTTIVWEILPKNDGIQINMTHVGLVPGIECFEDCTKGWDFYVKESLLQYLTMSNGLPGTGIRATVSNAGRVYGGTLFSKNDPTPDFPEGYLYLDVKETNVEHVLSAYAVDRFDKLTFDAKKLTGSHYMIVENRPLYGLILPMDDLLEMIG